MGFSFEPTAVPAPAVLSAAEFAASYEPLFTKLVATDERGLLEFLSQQARMNFSVKNLDGGTFWKIYWQEQDQVAAACHTGTNARGELVILKALVKAD